LARDFTILKYRELLEAIRRSGYPVLPVHHFLSEKTPPDHCFILRHDVDRKVDRALVMAAVEKELGFKSTYYFRAGWRFWKPEVVRKIAALGHEIGYHYEVLSKAKGDQEKARRIFAKELAWMRRIVEVRTAAQHGNPLSPWDNLSFWHNNHPGDFGLAGEAYLSFRSLPRVSYITDTGRCWNSEKDNLRDRFPPGGPLLPGPFFSTDELIKLFEKRSCEQIYCLVHPNRWTSGGGAWFLQWGEDACANWMKRRLRRVHSTWRRIHESSAR